MGRYNRLSFGLFAVLLAIGGLAWAQQGGMGMMGGMCPCMMGQGGMGQGGMGQGGMMPGMMGQGGMGQGGMMPGMMGQGGMGQGGMMPGMMGQSGMGQGGMMGAAPAAQLSEAQQKKLAQIRTDWMKRERQDMAQVGERWRDLQQLMMSEQPEPKAVGQAYDKLAAAQRDALVARIEAQNRMSKVLSSDAVNSGQ